MLFLEWEPSILACSPSWLTEICQEDTLLWRIYLPSVILAGRRFELHRPNSLSLMDVYFYSSMWKLCDHECSFLLHSASLSPPVFQIRRANAVKKSYDDISHQYTRWNNLAMRMTSWALRTGWSWIDPALLTYMELMCRYVHFTAAPTITTNRRISTKDTWNF